MSTETMESVGIATFTDIVEQMDFHLACSHPDHDHDTDEHDGDAAWLARISCDECGWGDEPLVCDKWKVSVLRGTYEIECGRCKAHWPAKEWAARQTWVAL